jgi:hypothetical protein
MKETIGMIIAICFPVLGIAALIYMGVTGPKNRALVDRELFTPYVKALSAGQWAEAWAFYDPELQKKKPLQEFVAHYEAMVKELGPVKSHKINDARGAMNPFAKTSGYTVDCTIHFEKGAVGIFYDAERREGGPLRILSTGARTPKYARRNMPW